ncbi:MAG TPA: arginine repressor [Clostridiales bacterium]|nr:arginine repressor [Clostridiales bacterium]
MKKLRQQKVLELIKSRPIETQEELLYLLKQAGFDVTQATISRDIKELRIVKVLDSNGKYRYVSNSGQTSDVNERYAEIFVNSVKSIDYAMNNVVIKCFSGTAMAACAALDHLYSDLMVGTLAGDDTILAITRDEEGARALTEKLSELINKG